MDHVIPQPGLFVLYPAGRATDGLLIFRVIQQIIIGSTVYSYMLIRPKAIITSQRLKVPNFRISRVSHDHTDPDWALLPLGTCAHYTGLQSLCSSSSSRWHVFQGLQMPRHGFTGEIATWTSLSLYEDQAAVCASPDTEQLQWLWGYYVPAHKCFILFSPLLT